MHVEVTTFFNDLLLMGRDPYLYMDIMEFPLCRTPQCNNAVLMEVVNFSHYLLLFVQMNQDCLRLSYIKMSRKICRIPGWMILVQKIIKSTLLYQLWLEQ